MNVKDATHATVHDYPKPLKIPMARFNPDDCKYCNNTDGVCCHEAIRTDNKAQAHIIDAQDEHYNKRADSHVFMMNGEQGGN